MTCCIEETQRTTEFLTFSNLFHYQIKKLTVDSHQPLPGVRLLLKIDLCQSFPFQFPTIISFTLVILCRRLLKTAL